MARRVGLASDISASCLPSRNHHQYHQLTPLRAVPVDMRVSSVDIDQWADTTHARGQLPELIRRLIGATATLTQLAVRGADTSNFGGWDGAVTATQGNAWVPVGASRWEMGCSQNPIGKARSDFRERTRATPTREAAQLDFVFVTPRIWAGKDAWQEEARAEGHWRSVRAYDADDLASWLEAAGGVRLWFAESLGLSGPGIASVGAVWNTWRNQTRAPITVEALSTGRSPAVEQFTKVVPGTPRLVSLEADSIEEAVAFACSQLVDSNHADSAMCVTATDGWRYVDANSGIRIVVAASSAVAAASAPREGLTLVVPSAFGNRALTHEASPTPDTVQIQLARSHAHEFENALIELGEEATDAARLSRSCGRSWSVYRRVRAVNPAVRTPAWMTDSAARSLATIVLLGGWNGARPGDVACVEAVTAEAYEQTERELLHLARLDDAPVLKIGSVWKAKAPRELLYLFGPRLTREQKRRLFDSAEAVLSKPDPALELPVDQRWMAAVYGKVREESGVVIGSILDSVTKLSVYAEGVGDHDITDGVDRLVNRLLENASADRWLSLSGSVRELAEAAPRQFLRAVNSGLVGNPPSLKALFAESEGDPMLHRDSHTSLLWALEVLAWSPSHLAHVCDALARMMAFPVRANLSNRPSNSLISLFRPWWPQTTASAQVRLGVLDRLIADQPEAAWEVVASSIRTRSMWASPNATPHWRDDNAGSPNPNQFDASYASELGVRCLDLARGHASRIAQLLEMIESFDGEYRDEVVALVRSAAEFADQDRQTVRDALRRHLAWQQAPHREGAGHTDELQALRNLFDALAPVDLPSRHAWLFESQWVELPDGREEDYQATEAARDNLRTQALEEIFAAQAWGGVERLLALTNPGLVGWCLPTVAAAAPGLSDWLLGYLEKQAYPTHDPVARGVMHALPSNTRVALMQAMVNSHVDDLCLAVLSAAPVERETWEMVATLSESMQQAYWRNLSPHLVLREHEDIAFAVDKLMAVDRSRTAFSILQLHWDAVSSARLAEVLAGVSHGHEPDGPPPDGYRVARAIDALAKDESFPKRSIALLQFQYFRAFETKSGALTLYSEMASDPEFFMEFASLAFKPRDAQDDRPDVHESIVSTAWQVLHQGRAVPGADDDGTVEPTHFSYWVAQVRARAAELHRSAPVDSTIGSWLSSCPTDPDGVWPCRPVRELLEDPAAETIRNGFVCGVRNNRGIHSRGIFDGGLQERTLADKYRAFAQPLLGTFPLTAACLLEITRGYEFDARTHDDEADMMREHP